MTVGYQISLWTNPWGITWFEVGTRYICGLARHSASYWVHAMSDVGIPEFTVHGISILQLQPVVGAVQILVVTSRRLSYSLASSTVIYRVGGGVPSRLLCSSGSSTCWAHDHSSAHLAGGGGPSLLVFGHGGVIGCLPSSLAEDFRPAGPVEPVLSCQGEVRWSSRTVVATGLLSLIGLKVSGCLAGARCSWASWLGWD